MIFADFGIRLGQTLDRCRFWYPSSIDRYFEEYPSDAYLQICQVSVILDIRFGNSSTNQSKIKMDSTLNVIFKYLKCVILEYKRKLTSKRSKKDQYPGVLITRLRYLVLIISAVGLPGCTRFTQSLMWQIDHSKILKFNSKKSKNFWSLNSKCDSKAK